MKPRRSLAVLSYPPASSVWHLPMGIAYLAALAEQRGHDVIQEYGYIKAVEYVLREFGGPAIEGHLCTVRDPDSSVLQRYDARIAFESVTRNLGTIENFVVERNNVRCDSSRFKGRIDDLLWVIRNREEHVFYRYFRDVEVARVMELKPDVYGISVSDERQLVSGCVLAALVKQALPNTLVVMGGNYWARMLDAYRDPAFAQLFDFWDAIVYAEGFQPFLQLLEKIPVPAVPGVVWHSGSRVTVNPPAAAPTEFDSLPTPVFARDTRQWSPDFVPPLYTMSNCPMRCSFCSIAAGSDTYLTRPRSMCPSRVVDHMIALGARRFDFVDELLTLPRQLAIGKELARRGYQATWQSYLTVNDKLLDPDLCNALADAGCRGVQLGLESLNPDILRQESKRWNHPDNYGRILKNLHDAGIQTHVFTIVGVPNEPINWSLRWLAFFEEYGEHITTIKSGRYRLSRLAPDEQRASQGLLDGVQSSATDSQLLNLNRDQFRYTKYNLSRRRVEAVRDLLEEACRRHWAYQVTSTVPWWVNRGRHSWAELRSMADLLARERPAEPSISPSHLKRALTKSAAAVRDELSIDVRFASYEDAVTTARHLFDASTGSTAALPGAAIG